MKRNRSPVAPITIEPALHCSVEEQRRLLGASPFFSGLPAERIEEIQRLFRQQHYDEGASIQVAGGRADRLSIVAAGTVKVVRPTVDGRDVLLDLLGPGEHFGSLAELGDSIHREDVTAHTACCILYTTADTFQHILSRYPSVALATLQLVAERLRNAHSAIEQLSVHPVEHRVAATLLYLAGKRGTARAEGGTLIEIPLSRQDLADMTGAKVETVSRIMSEFRRRGLTESGRRWISVLDPEGLAVIAQETFG